MEAQIDLTEVELFATEALDSQDPILQQMHMVKVTCSAEFYVAEDDVEWLMDMIQQRELVISPRGDI